MANNKAKSPSVEVEDLIPVRSRVSWGAILAGAVAALAVSLILTLLGTAIGVSISDRVRAETLGISAALWAVFAIGASLFLGGWITSQCTVGENKCEAVVHGIVMWGAAIGIIMWFGAQGVQSGLSAMATAASAGAAVTQNTTPDDWEAAARRAGVSQASINEWKQSADNAAVQARVAAEDPAKRQEALDATKQVTWYTLLGVVLSLMAAVSGALVGAGPSFRLFAIPVINGRTTTIVSPQA